MKSEAKTDQRNPGRLQRCVRVAAKWLCALIILPPVALIYLPSCVLAEIFTTFAKLADSVGKRFDEYWN